MGEIGTYRSNKIKGVEHLSTHIERHPLWNPPYAPPCDQRSRRLAPFAPMPVRLTPDGHTIPNCCRPRAMSPAPPRSLLVRGLRCGNCARQFPDDIGGCPSNGWLVAPISRGISLTYGDAVFIHGYALRGCKRIIRVIFVHFRNSARIPGDAFRNACLHPRIIVSRLCLFRCGLHHRDRQHSGN